MRSNHVLLAILSISLALAAAAPALAGSYSARGGTFVVKAGGTTLVDNGAVVCHGFDGSGEGGGCLAFGPKNDSREGVFIGVTDQSAGLRVAFQVCIDNNGDGLCGGQFLPTDRCPDQIFFSHADGGRFFNALGPLPRGPLPGCESSAFPAYVVLLCQGVHEDPEAGAHTHSLTTGAIYRAPFGSGYGDFCGGNGGGTPTGINTNTAAKAYRVA